MSPVVILLLLVVVVVPAQCDQCVTVEGLPNGQVGAHCVFPFIHKNVTYVGCKKLVKKPGEGWCSTKVDSDGQHIKGNWGQCGRDCDFDCGGEKKCVEKDFCPLFHR